jgi:hypothetical protein
VFSFIRRFAIASVAVVIVAAGGLAVGKSYGQREFAKSATVHIDDALLPSTRAGDPTYDQRTRHHRRQRSSALLPTRAVSAPTS